MDFMANFTGICMGGFRTRRHWMSVFPSECILSEKMTRNNSGHSGPEEGGDMGRS